jgi:1-acyl-sn-glycerol-3-phosphate acyltransferase
VGVFPSGKRTRKWNEYHKPRANRGAAFLAVKHNAPILPIKIEGNIGMRFLGFLGRKYKIKVKIGKPFYLHHQDLNKPENLNYPSNLIMDKITNL